MPKTTAKTQKTPATSAPTPTPTPTATATAPKQSKGGKKVATKVVESVESVESVVSTEPSVVVSTTDQSNTVVESVELVGIDQAFKDVTANLLASQASIKAGLADLRKLEKRVQKELREAKKGRRRRKVQEGGEKAKRAPSGFAKPSELSSELCGFLGVESGTLMARTEVTKHITKYIRDHELQDPSYKRRILCDKSLGSLLNVGTNDEVTYFNLQSFMKPHFPKSAASLAAEAAATALATA